jgi:hypothetical protein
MEKNKTGKYFKYAIGEIILVVIGILIALSLNNWNERRKQDSDFDKLIDALENEIIDNINEANYEISWAREVQAYGTEVLTNKISRQEFIENPNLSSLIELNRLDINSDDVSSLVSRPEAFPENYKVLIPHLKNYLKIKDRYNKTEIENVVPINRFSDYLIKTQPWFASSNSQQILDSIALNKQIDFYLEDPVYKNYLATYIDGYKYSVREMIGVRSACLVILAEIKRIREDLGPDEIKILFGEYNMTPYLQKTCDDSQVSGIDFNEPETYLPLYNASNQTRSIQWIGDVDGVEKIELKPGELTINPASKRMQENVLIDILLNEECIMKYQAKVNGYLLIK